MSIQRCCFVVLGTLLLGGMTRPAAAQSPPPPVYNPGNGHWYQAVPVPGGIAWPAARAAAAAMSYAGYAGHLVTITSTAETQFLVSSLTSNNPAAVLVPSSVAVLPGFNTVTFPIVTFPVTAATSVQISAGGSFGTAAATLAVLPLASSPPIPPPSGVRLLVSSHNSNNEADFAIWRRTAGTDWARVGIVPPNTTTFTDTGLQRGTTYTYRVRATNQYASDWSNEVTVTTLP